MKQVRKLVTTLLAGTALAVVSTHASAVSISGSAYSQTDTVTGNTYSNPTGHIQAVDHSASASFNEYTTVKSWADLAIDLGWMHGLDWVQLNVGQAGNYEIRQQVTGLRNDNGTWVNENKNLHPAFSMWKLGGNTFTTTGSTQNTQNSFVAPHPTTGVPTTYNYGAATDPAATHYTGVNSYGADAQYNNNMGFNQVVDPAMGNNSQFLLTAGVTGIVGYSNTGVSFINGDGDAVGAGSVGSFLGTNADGFLYAGLTTYLDVGSYVFAFGGNCVNLVDCGPVRSVNATTGAITWGTAWYQSTITYVPEPGTFLLFVSGMLGAISVRRKQLAVA